MDQQQPGAARRGGGARTRPSCPGRWRAAPRGVPRLGAARAGSSAAARRPPAGSSRPARPGQVGRTASIRPRMAMAYAAPLGLRRLSSSTRQPPYSLRTRSKPMTGARTAPAGSRRASSRQPGEPPTTSSGSTPSRGSAARRRRRARNDSIARARWMRPAASSCPLVRAERPGASGRRRTAAARRRPRRSARARRPTRRGPASARRARRRPARGSTRRCPRYAGRGRAGPDGLVPGPDAVAAQRRRPPAADRPPGRWVSSTTSSHDVLEPAALGERGALPVGGVAAGQHRLGQLATSSQSPSSSSCGAAGRPGPGRRRRPGTGRGWPAAVEQLAGQPAAGGPPDRRPVHRRRRAASNGRPASISCSAARTTARNSPAIRIGVVDDRAGVADPQLEGGRVRGRPDVEVGHLRVGDDAGVDQVGDQLVVLGGRRRAGRWRRRWASAAR